jgi:sterol desaturase/sphingolipid hydroxylase (fatty acid hydroxylase superfamily)
MSLPATISLRPVLAESSVWLSSLWEGITTNDSELLWVKSAATVGSLAALWTWESAAPAVGGRQRLRHAARNLALALANTLLIALLFGALVLAVARWTHENGVGLLNLSELPLYVRLPAALVLLDLWLYLWHRANHAVPLLWRFHRAHHADEQMDVTTATRFHPGELIFSASLRLLLIPLLGLEVGELLIYDTIVTVCTQLHHADVSLGRFDRVLRLLIVSPGMHAVHHSVRRQECDSNYGVVLSLWDRLAGSFHKPGERRPTFGAPGVRDGGTLAGVLLVPFTSSDRTAPSARPRPPSPAG